MADYLELTPAERAMSQVIKTSLAKHGPRVRLIGPGDARGLTCFLNANKQRFTIYLHRTPPFIDLFACGLRPDAILEVAQAIQEACEAYSELRGSLFERPTPVHPGDERPPYTSSAAHRKD